MMADSGGQSRAATQSAKWLRKHQYNILVYSGAAVAIVFIYHFFSDGDFSFLLTLGACARLLAFAMLLSRVALDRGCPGVSLKTLQLYTAVYFFRLCSDVFYEGYRPYDKTGDWFYTVVEVCGFVLVSVLTLLVAVPYRETYDWRKDSFGQWLLPGSFGGLWLVVPSVALAAVVHPSLNQSFWIDSAWTTALYLEAVCVLPQLHMFQTSRRAVEAWMSHFVFLLFLSRVFLLVFWVSTHHELNAHGPSVTGGWVGYFVLACQAVQVLLMASFAFQYVRSAARGEALLLPA